MNDIEYHRDVPVYTSDLYLDLQRIEERGIRLRQARRRRLVEIFSFVNRWRHNPAAETA